MKVRQSGMPDESMWNSFFDIPSVLSELQIDSQVSNLVEIGTGYGTFTIPAARLITGTVYGFDIEKDMLDIVTRNLLNECIENVVLEQRDILAETTGLADNSVDYVMLFNILHHESPNDFLQEAYRILKQNGRIGIIHWRSDVETPRGPDLSIRPKPEQLVALIDKQKFRIEKEPFLVRPFHYGLLVSKL